ncbi:MAG: hypothetical protein LUO93_00425, partial [Methanomicrobiales archaeon]|nr:hypothetical protein [Methanomicrobiales archaeon]
SSLQGECLRRIVLSMHESTDHPYAIRFSKPLRGKIAKFCEDFYKETKVRLNFSDAVRTLVERGLVAKGRR